MTAARRWWPAGAALFLLGCWIASVALARLAEARSAHRALLAVTASPLPPVPALVPPGQAITSAATLATRLRTEALRSRILAEQVAPVRAGARLVAADVAVSGGEAAVLGFVHAIEAGPPAVRFAGWRIEALPGGAIRLRGRAVAGW